jgi:hypothetical protein
MAHPQHPYVGTRRPCKYTVELKGSKFEERRGWLIGFVTRPDSYSIYEDFALIEDDGGKIRSARRDWVTLLDFQESQPSGGMVL